VEACTLLCESHQNPEVISNYLTTDILKFVRYAIATSLHRQTVDGFVNQILKKFRWWRLTVGPLRARAADVF
jgi:hypothetical protein